MHICLFQGQPLASNHIKILGHFGLIIILLKLRIKLASVRIYIFSKIEDRFVNIPKSTMNSELIHNIMQARQDKIEKSIEVLEKIKRLNEAEQALNVKLEKFNEAERALNVELRKAIQARDAEIKKLEKLNENEQALNVKLEKLNEAERALNVKLRKAIQARDAEIKKLEKLNEDERALNVKLRKTVQARDTEIKKLKKRIEARDAEIEKIYEVSRAHIAEIINRHYEEVRALNDLLHKIIQARGDKHMKYMWVYNVERSRALNAEI
jgi:DNA repair exonuclease SbcCD ATPase subunit